jgi:predicted dehydrogenase
MSSPIRIGLIGAGSVARRVHAPGLRLCPDVEIAAAADPDPKAAAAIGAPHLYDDPAKLLAEAPVDAVVVAVPNHLHHDIVMEAIAAGKHVLCEKPLAMGAPEAEAMLAAARQAGVVHMTAFTYGFMPAVRYLRHLVEQGELGEIRSVRCAYQMALAGHVLGWRSQTSLAGSGVLGDLGSHLIHIVLDLAGELEALSGWQKRFREDPSSDVEDWIGFIGEFASGAVGTFEISRVCPGRGADVSEEMFIEVYGSKGGAVFSMQEPRALRLAIGAAGHDPTSPFERVEVPREFWKLTGSPRDVDEGDPRWTYRYDQAFQFVSSIRDGEVREPSFEAGLRTQRVLDAALLSAATREWTRIF